MKVTVTVEVDVYDEHDRYVTTARTASVLKDKDRIDSADLVNVYDADRHNLMVELHEKGLHPRWAYPQMYGKRSSR